MMDLKVSTTTHDLEVSAFDLQLIDQSEYLAQKLKIRLLFIYQEWFLDTALGVPYFEQIWVKTPDIPKIETILKATILETEGVTELLAFSTDLDRAARRLTVEFTVNTIYGPLTLTETI